MTYLSQYALIPISCVAYPLHYLSNEEYSCNWLLAVNLSDIIEYKKTY